MLMATIASVVIMRGEGLDSPVIGALVIGPFALAAAVLSYIRLTQTDSLRANP